MSSNFDALRSETVPKASPEAKGKRRRNALIAGLVSAVLIGGAGFWGVGAYYDKKKRDALEPAVAQVVPGLHYDAKEPVKTTAGRYAFSEHFSLDSTLKYKHQVYYSNLRVDGNSAQAELQHRLTAEGQPTLDYRSPLELLWTDGQWMPKASAASVLPFGLTNGKLVGKVVKVSGTIQGAQGELKEGGNRLLLQKLREGELATKLKAASVTQVFVAGTDGKPVKHVAGPEEVTSDSFRVSLSDKHYRGAREAIQYAKDKAAIVGIDTTNGHVLNLTSAGSSSVARHSLRAPGSTFKIVTALALLRSGMTPESMVECPAEIMVNGRKFKNYGEYPAKFVGKIKLKDALAQSCNTAFIRHGMRLKWADVHKAAQDLGMLGPNAGLYADARVPKVIEDRPQRAASLIGQGLILATPGAMAAVAASVRMGKTAVPNVRLWQPPPAATGELKADEAQQLRQMMEYVVSNGTGEELRPLGGLTGAKTGTAQHDRGDVDDAWMIGFHGNVAVAVYIAGGGSGSHAAGPMAKHYFLATR